MSEQTVPEQPTLTDGEVTLRPWRDDDIDEAIAGHDQELAYWFGFAVVTPPYQVHKNAVDEWHRSYADGRRTVNFLIEAHGAVVGCVEVRQKEDGIGELSWAVYATHRRNGYAVRATRMLVDYAFEALDLLRVEAYVNVANEASKRVATRSGLRREGIMRSREDLFGERHDTMVFARLRDDPPVTDAAGFRALLNSFLPRKRAIGQMLVRDTASRVLLCQLTYKRDWDLPGGVVEVGESPREAVGREVLEELGLNIEPGALVLTDWLPPWGGWDDAICLVFDGGTHDPSIVDDIVEQAREIRSAQFCTLGEIREHCADFTARRIEAALRGLQTGVPGYSESGR